MQDDPILADAIDMKNLVDFYLHRRHHFMNI